MDINEYILGLTRQTPVTPSFNQTELGRLVQGIPRTPSFDETDIGRLIGTITKTPPVQDTRLGGILGTLNTNPPIANTGLGDIVNNPIQTQALNPQDYASVEEFVNDNAEKGKWSKQGLPAFHDVVQDMIDKHGRNETGEGYTTENGVKVIIPQDSIGKGGLENFQRIKGVDDRTLWIDTIESKDKGKGGASKALQEIIDSADKRGVDLILYPRIFKQEKGQLTHKQLVDWYERKGFVKAEDGSMIRKSKLTDIYNKGKGKTQLVKTNNKKMTDVLNKSGKKVGYIRASIKDGNAEIDNIFINKEDRNKGYGKSAIDEFMKQQEVKSISGIVLSEEAKKFWEKIGIDVDEEGRFTKTQGKKEVKFDKYKNGMES